MFIPLHDANPLRHIRFQFVTFGLILANILVYFLTVLTVSEQASFADALALGYIPAVVNDFAELPSQYVLVPENFTYFTYAFLHADLIHLGGNMLFLWVFADNVEDAMGHVKFLIFYLTCAAAGAFLHGIIMPESEAPLVGASGAVAGIVAAYLILHPKVKLWVLAFMRIPLRIPAWIPLLLWLSFQFLMFFIQTEDVVSWPAHIGGIIAGAALVLLLRRPNISSNPAINQPQIQPTILNEPKVTHSKWGRPS